jgi:hypothetical protein
MTPAAPARDRQILAEQISALLTQVEALRAEVLRLQACTLDCTGQAERSEREFVRG